MTDPRVHVQELGSLSLTSAQAHALRVAVRNGRWWLAGKGAPQTARNLERRGLATLHRNYDIRPIGRYIVPTDAGRQAIGAHDG